MVRLRDEDSAYKYLYFKANFSAIFENADDL